MTPKSLLVPTGDRAAKGRARTPAPGSGVQLVHLLEVVLLRATPGAVNLATLLLIGAWMSPREYGLYSTIIATTAFVANVGFGPLMFGVISQHAKLEAAGHAAEYESSIVSLILLITLALLSCGSAAAMIGVIHWSWLTPAIAVGAYSAVQEILHARLRLWTYGAAALIQALVFIGLSWTFVRTRPSVDAALNAFAASYAVAFSASLFFSGFPRLRWPDLRMLSETLRAGGNYTVGTAMELGLYLGLRYLVFLMGSKHYLGTFSFCVDLAQRLIGFLVSAVGFRVVPAAFRAEVVAHKTEFSRMLRGGTIVAVVLSAASFTGVLIVRELDVVRSLSSVLFDPRVFAVISLAVVVNRVKKIILDPFAMRAGNTFSIAVGYALGTATALSFAVVGLRFAGRGVAEGAYLLGCLVATVVTGVAVRRVNR